MLLYSLALNISTVFVFLLILLIYSLDSDSKFQLSRSKQTNVKSFFFVNIGKWTAERCD